MEALMRFYVQSKEKDLCFQIKIEKENK